MNFTNYLELHHLSYTEFHKVRKEVSQSSFVVLLCEYFVRLCVHPLLHKVTRS